MKKMIAAVQNNAEKANTYRELMTRYNKAVKEGFYFEALLIEDAMSEDRTLSFLYHCGVQNSRDSLKVSKISRNNLLKTILPAEEGKVRRYSLDGLGRKIEIIDAVLKWSCEIDYTPEDKYLRTLKRQLESLDIYELQETLKCINKWKDYRNEVIHGLLNKKIDILWLDVASQVEEGMKLARSLDNQVRIVKKNNKIRKAANLPIRR